MRSLLEMAGAALAAAIAGLAAAGAGEAPMKAYGGPIFDVQAHAIKPSAVAAASAGIEAAPYLSPSTKKIIVEDIFPKAADDLAGPARLQALGADGIEVVTVNISFPALPPAALIGIVESTNSWMAAKTAGRRQLIGTAILPPAPALAKAGLAPDGVRWADKGLASLRQAIVQQKLKGIMASSNYDGVFLGDPVFEPYFALAAELKVPVIIHPAIEPADSDFIVRRQIPILAGYLNDQRNTLLDLVKAGILEKYPGLTIIATHLGGGILTSLGRFEQLALRFPDEKTFTDRDGQPRELPHPVSFYLKKIYYDCNNAAAADIAHAASVVGVGHLLTGTDFPWATDGYTREVLGALDPQTARQVAYDNAARLFAAGR